MEDPKTDPPVENVPEAAPDNPAATIEPPKQILPTCPYCGADPFEPAGQPYNPEMSRVRLLIHFCKACRKVINVEVIEVAQSRIQMPPKRPMVI
jgi:hypothetical protein